MRLRNIILLTILAAVSSALCGAAEQPQLAGAKVINSSAKAGVRAAIDEIISANRAPVWIAYSVPVIPGQHHMCCWTSVRALGKSACCGLCRLENRDSNISLGNQVDGCKATLASIFFVFMRAEN